MSHLSDDQLSARLDASGVADAAAAEAADRHLADCAECRERLAALSELDASLKGALTHDPGDAYFASFADRVSARLAASPAEAPATAPATAASPARGAGGFFGWLLSPRGLTLAGSAAGLAVVAALAFVLSRDGGSEKFAEQVAPRSVVGTGGAPAAGASAAAPSQESQESQAPKAPQAATSAAPSAPAPKSKPRSASAEREVAQAPAARREAATDMRAREVRTDAAGEPVPVQTQSQALGRPAPTTTPDNGSGPVRVRKPQTVTPMTGAPATSAPKSSTPAQRAPEPVETAAPAPAPVATAPAPSAPSAPAVPAAPAPTKPRFDVSRLFEKAKSAAGSASGSAGSAGSTSAPQATSQGFSAPPQTNDAVAPNVTPPPVAEGGKRVREAGAPGANFRASSYDMAASRAREAAAVAARTHAASDWDRASSAWSQAAAMTGEPALQRAAYREAAQARATAWRTEPNELRRVAARSAVRAWLSVAEPGAEQDEAKRLEAELTR